jgi:general secretion pathway protein J
VRVVNPWLPSIASGKTAAASFGVRLKRLRQVSADGFTLLEVLVVLAVLGLLFAGLLQTSRFVLFGSDMHTRLLERKAELDTVDRLLRSLIEQARPGSDREKLIFFGTAHAVTFTSVMPMPTTEFQRQRADVKLVVDGAHRLLLVWTPHLHAIRIGQPPQALSTEILQGVERLDLSYWPAGQSGDWTPVWNNPAPPRLVRIRIVFSDAGHPLWPEILAAPILAPL